MPRTHARIRLDMWSDDDYRDLTMGAQWLYEFLLSAPATTFAGVHPWRPGTIAGHATDLTADDVEFFAGELEEGRYLVIDRGTEECLIRSFVKHDGLVSSPNMVKALVKLHAQIGSPAIRGVIVHELKRLKRREPDLKGWSQAADLLRKRAIPAADAIAGLPPNPSRNPSGNPSATPSGHPSGTPVLLSSLPPSLHQGSSPVGESPEPTALTLGSRREAH